jgi:hypothetical protein
MANIFLHLAHLPAIHNLIGFKVKYINSILNIFIIPKLNYVVQYFMLFPTM